MMLQPDLGVQHQEKCPGGYNEFYRQGCRLSCGTGNGQRATRDTLDAVSTNFEIWYNPTLGYLLYLYGISDDDYPPDRPAAHCYLGDQG